MRKNLGSSASKFFVGVIVGAVLFSGSAVAYNNYVSDNTPENGYLLCANLKTKAVTFPNKLSCPSGTKALDLGAVTGVEGPEGPEGPVGPEGQEGPPGTSSGAINYYKRLPNQDVVVDGVITDNDKAKKFIVGTLYPSDLPNGYYRLDAHLSGLWSETVFNLSSKPFIRCYFQEKKDYDSGSGLTQWGAAKADYVSWTGIAMNVQGYAWFLSSTDSPVHLVCSTTAIVKGFGGMLEALSAEKSIVMKGSSSS